MIGISLVIQLPGDFNEIRNLAKVFWKNKINGCMHASVLVPIARPRASGAGAVYRREQRILRFF